MQNNNHRERKGQKMVYSKPRLATFGTLRDVTLTSSQLGTGDSGNSYTYKP